MDDTPIPAPAPAAWLEALAESDAQLAAGQIVDGEDVMRELDECITPLEAKRTAKLHRRAAPHVAVAPGLLDQAHVVIRADDDTDEEYAAKQRLLDAALAFARKG